MLEYFEKIARSAGLFTHERLAEKDSSHPFDQRNIHPKIPDKVKRLFDDAHYAEATFAASKFLDKSVARFAGSKKSGSALMQEVFREAGPAIQLTPLSNSSEVDEQKGYQWIFTGSVWAIRNPRGHEHDIDESVDQCLDHLSFISMLMRRLEQAGHKF